MCCTADLVDAFEDRVQSCSLQLRSFGRRSAISGPIQTIRCFEDNTLVRAEVETPGEGRVLVVDGGGSLRRALVGDILAGLALDNGWSGIVIHGVIRDAEAIDALDIGVKSLGTNPLKSRKEGAGAVGETISFGGVRFESGAWLYSDSDGILVSSERLSLPS